MRLRPTLLLTGAAFGALAATAAAQEAAPAPEAAATQEAPAPAAPEVTTTDPEQVIDFAADTLTYDNETDVVTAQGNVILVRGGYRLRANTVEYNRRTGFVEARGNVVVIDPGGNQAFGDRVELAESLRDGAIENIQLVLQDGGRLAAR